MGSDPELQGSDPILISPSSSHESMVSVRRFHEVLRAGFLMIVHGFHTRSTRAPA